MPKATFSLSYLRSLLSGDSPENISKKIDDYGIEHTLTEKEIEVELTTERPDLLSPEGLARVLRAFQGQANRYAHHLPTSGRKVRVDPKVKEMRPNIAAVVARDISISAEGLEELLRFQDKASITFGRERKRLAIGVYDLDQIQGDVLYTLANRGEVRLVPLKGERVMTAQEIINSHQTGIKYRKALPEGENIPVLYDENGKVLSIPPIINADPIGAVNSSTKNIFVDITGTSRKAVQEMARMMACNFIDMGARVESVGIEGEPAYSVTPSFEPRIIPISRELVKKIMGQDFPADELRRNFFKMDMRFDEVKSTVEIPPYRTDIISEVDLVGDLVVSQGVNNLPYKAIVTEELGKADPLKERVRGLSGLSQRMGFSEVKTFILTDPDLVRDFSSDFIRADNAKSRLYSACRPTLKPGLLQILSKNGASSARPLKVYETGETLGLSRGGIYETLNWGFAVLDVRSSFSTAKSYMQTVLGTLGINYSLEENNGAEYIPGRAATIKVNGEKVGDFGEIHPVFLRKFSLTEPVCLGEIDLGRI